MKAQDLMVGNLVLDRGGKTLRIDYFEQDKVCMEMEGSYLNPYPLHPLTEYFEYLQPIILSEEILLKCGFDKKKHTYSDRYILDDFELERQGVNYACVVWCGEDAPHLTIFIGHCEYLHELQQLYKILTKQELGIKL